MKSKSTHYSKFDQSRLSLQLPLPTLELILQTKEQIEALSAYDRRRPDWRRPEVPEESRSVPNLENSVKK